MSPTSIWTRGSATSKVIRSLLVWPLAAAGLALLVTLVFLAIAPHLFTRADPVRLSLGERLRPPSSAHPFGTDDFGRDILTRVIYGTRISLGSGVAVIASSILWGGVVGTLAGFRGGWSDELLMRVTDMFMAFPPILLAMAVVIVLRPGSLNTTLALIVVWWPAYARLLRAQVLAIRERAYVEAATALGARPRRIILRHVLPNAFAPILVQATMDMGYVVLAAAGLGFLGLGAQPPAPEWGKMVSDGRRYFLEAWWFPVFPGTAIAATVLAFNLIGDDLRDWLDPRSRPF
ncbi:MAG TPA: ABC transporter permease [Chloroflexota bacterium]